MKLIIDVDQINQGIEKTLFHKEIILINQQIDELFEFTVGLDNVGLMVTFDPATGGITGLFGHGKVVKRHTAAFQETLINVSCNIDDETPFSLCFRYKEIELQLFFRTLGLRF